MYPKSATVVGVTGGLATGKSLVTALLAAHGAVTFSADEAARAVTGVGSGVPEALAREFGPEVLTPEGAIDRARLAQRAFASDEARARLDRITHPPILRLLRAQIESAQDDLPDGSIIVVEAPLLFEAQIEGWFGAIVVVAAPAAVQVARLRARSGLNAGEARRRLAAQWPLEAKIAKADFVVENAGTMSNLRTVVDELWRLLRARARFRDV